MIQKLRLVRAIGQFEAVTSASAIDLKKLTLIYAENAKGKTTLAAILRSLSTGEPVPIEERRRLGSTDLPEAIIDCVGSTTPACFRNGAWSRSCPDVLVFDDFFVDRNVYSGLDVDAEHRQNLHDLILGATGVSLARRVDELAARARTHSADLRVKSAAIPLADRQGLSVDDFCGLAPRVDIDAAIREAEQRLDALQNQNAVRTTPVFQAFALRPFDSNSFAQLLAKGIPELDQTAAESVKAHFQALGAGAEEWISAGMRFAMPGGTETEECPFCKQPLNASVIFAHYRLFFGQAYKQLQSDIIAREHQVQGALSGDALAGFQRQVQAAQQRREFWARFAQVPDVGLDLTDVATIWQQARDAILFAIRQKKADPLTPITLDGDALAKIEAFGDLVSRVRAASDALVGANADVTRVKEATRGGSTATADTDLKRLRATKARHVQPTADRCQAYLAEVAAKQVTDGEKATAQQALDNYRSVVFPNWETALNTYLAGLGANFTIRRVESQPTPGRPSCVFKLLINGQEVPVGATNPTGGHGFKTTLSAGDRNTLALAYFLASVDQDPQRASKIVVLDDPMCSLDKHRRRQTIHQMRQLVPNVAQLIVMSHDEHFLFDVYDHLAIRNRFLNDTVTITVAGRGPASSTIDVWDIESERVGQHDKRHALLTAFRDNGVGDPQKVAQSIRPHLERYLRTTCPNEFRQGELFGQFKSRALATRANGSPIISDAKLAEVERLVDYGNEFHHDTNPSWDTVVINVTELTDFVRRTLTFVAI